MISTLPIYEIIPKLKKEISSYDSLVLQAPPGAGKTTVVPLELLHEPFLKNRKIIMLEPRRLAARAAAHRMADILGEKVGETVGYRVRMDSKIGPKTKIEVVTEGILIRQLQSDPELSNVAVVIFDEFHERSIDADLGLAFCLDIQKGLRDDLKLIVMSATLDGERVAKLMGHAPILTSEGQAFPVERHFLPRKPNDKIEHSMASAIMKALQEETGSILAFLPGAGEIERTKKILEEKKLGAEVLLCPLYGMMNFADQDKAISPATRGKRKIVLSTAIAETSLTIEGIRIVIDSGLSRNSFYDTKSGMPGIETKMVSRASADQRTGRAGRLETGVCYRLWSEAAERALIPFTVPEMKRVDLTSLYLSLNQWGVRNFNELSWLDMPEQATIDQAADLLTSLDAINENGITEHGKKMAAMPMHPRLSHMVVKADEIGHGSLALTVAALLEERDILALKQDQKTADLRLRVEAVLHIKNREIKAATRLGCKVTVAKRVLQQVRIWHKNYHIHENEIDIDKTGLCLSFAFPDRIGALRQGPDGAYLLSGGRGAKLISHDPLMVDPFLSIGHLDVGAREARIFMAAPIDRTDIEHYYKHQIEKHESISWDERYQTVRAEEKVLLGRMPLRVSKIKKPNKDLLLESLLFGIRKMGLSILPWDKNSNSFRRRVALLNAHGVISFDFSDQGLLDHLEVWLMPYLNDITNFVALSKLNLTEILKNTLDWQDQKKLDELVPTHFKVPSGSNIAIDYEMDPPVLAVKLQEMFGALQSPSIINGKVNLTVHLLSPARRPLQITTDLIGFWSSSYKEVQKEMKGRYPKHPWPDNPIDAIPTKKVKSKVN